MRTTPRSLGQTMPLILVSTIVLVCLGAAFFYFLQIFGGNGEHRNATDSGVLSLNKDAVIQSTPIDSQKDFQSMYSSALGIKTVNLGSYNNMIASATIVALNASADGLKTGQDNAVSVIKELEGSGQSLGAQLKNTLSDPDANKEWASTSFGNAAHANSERMLGKDAQAAWDKNQFKVAYLESAGSDTGASNVPVDKLISNMPIAYDDNGTANTMKVPDKMATTAAMPGSPRYLKGYQAITIPNISTPIYAVPTQPTQQPHLLSLSTFTQYTTQPGSASGVVLPPNGFEAGANANNTISSALSSSAAGIVGMPADPTPSAARIPQGFLVIDNSLTTGLNPGIKVPNGDNWEAVEAGTGTLVYRPNHAFSTESTVNGQPYNALKSWLATSRSGNFSPDKGPAITDDDGNALLYNSNGDPVTSKADAAKLIPNDTNDNDVVLATDENSDSDGNNPDGDCVVLATPTLPDNLSPFNRAYHPNANVTSGNDTGINLIASEQAKLYALGLYGPQYRAGTKGAYNQNFGLTGLRIFPNGVLPNVGGPYSYDPQGVSLPMGNPQRVPYGDPKVLGKVTTDGTILDLFNQTTGDPASNPYVRIDNDSAHSRKVNKPEQMTPTAEVQKFIAQRMREIKPTATDDEIKKVWEQKIPLGTLLYLYLKTPSDPNSEFVLTSTSPSWAGKVTANFKQMQASADGKRHAFSVTYPISDGTRDTGYMIDSPNDFGIHDHLFMTNTVSATATDAVSYQSSSGYNGLLGYIKFIEAVKASGSLKFPNQ